MDDLFPPDTWQPNQPNSNLRYGFMPSVFSMLAPRSSRVQVWASGRLLSASAKYTRCAIAASKRAMNGNPESSVACAYYAAALIKAGRLTDALAPARRALELNPSLPNAWSIYAAIMFRTGDPEAGARSLIELLNLRSGDLEAAAALANHYRNSGSIETGVGILERFACLDSPAGLFVRGLIADLVFDFDSATLLYEEYLCMHGFAVPVVRKYAAQLQASGLAEHAGALADISNEPMTSSPYPAIRSALEARRAQARSGNLLLHRVAAVQWWALEFYSGENWDELHACLGYLRSINRSPEVWFCTSIIRSANNMIDVAEEMALSGMEQFPAHPGGMLAMAHVCAAREDLQEAEMWTRRLLTEFPDTEQALDMLESILRHTGREAEAEVVSRRPTAPGWEANPDAIASIRSGIERLTTVKSVV